MGDDGFRRMTAHEAKLLAGIDTSGMSFLAAALILRIRRQGGDLTEDQARLLAAEAERQGLR